MVDTRDAGTRDKGRGTDQAPRPTDEGRRLDRIEDALVQEHGASVLRGSFDTIDHEYVNRPREVGS